MKKLLFLLGLTVGVITFMFVLEAISEMMDKQYVEG
jgi:hypothetical protein